MKQLERPLEDDGGCTGWTDLHPIVGRLLPALLIGFLGLVLVVLVGSQAVQVLSGVLDEGALHGLLVLAGGGAIGFLLARWGGSTEPAS